MAPDAMLATSTHDTKRSEDVRNRLDVLSEMTYVWPSYVRRWVRLNARHKRTLTDGRVAPSANEEYFIYQTLAGAWPWRMKTPGEREEFLQRMQQYMTKALSEAKVNLSWTNPNPAYVDAVHGFLRAILMPDERGRDPRFAGTMEEILPALRLFGAVNSLAQVVLKVASPGVPDFYQGTELWDLSLVDPDNRRPVDYEVRRQALAWLKEQATARGELAVCREILDRLDDGRVKLWTMHRALRDAEPDGGDVSAGRICAGDCDEWAGRACAGVHSGRKSAGGGSAICVHADEWEGTAAFEWSVGQRGVAGSGDGRGTSGKCVYRRDGGCRRGWRLALKLVFGEFPVFLGKEQGVGSRE